MMSEVLLSIIFKDEMKIEKKKNVLFDKKNLKKKKKLEELFENQTKKKKFSVDRLLNGASCVLFYFPTRFVYFYLFVQFRMLILFCMLIAWVEFLVVSSLHALTAKRMLSVRCARNRKEFRWFLKFDELRFMTIWKLFFYSAWCRCKAFMATWSGRDNYADKMDRGEKEGFLLLFAIVVWS